MLNKIFIKNYILIDELELDLSKGLNIITGETGAGKSILINAIDIAFGAKVGKEVIKKLKSFFYFCNADSLNKMPSIQPF